MADLQRLTHLLPCFDETPLCLTFMYGSSVAIINKLILSYRLHKEAKREDKR